MAESFYFLNESDRAIIQEMIRRTVNEYLNPRLRRGRPADEEDSPEVYVALTPEGGIAAADALGAGTSSGDIAQNIIYGEDCTVYVLTESASTVGEGALTRTDLTKLVYNFTDSDVPGSEFILIVRDKFGRWWAAGGVSDTGAGTGTADEGGIDQCSLAGLETNDCIAVTTDSGTFLLEYDGIDSWTSDEEFDYGNGSGTFVFWYADGALHLSLAGLELLNCGDGCFNGGPLTGHGPEGTGTGQPGNTGTAQQDTFCTGTSFTVCVSCTCCLPDGWYCVDLGSGCEPVYLTNADACDPTTTVCSGPFDSFSEAQAACLAINDPVGYCGCPAVPDPIKLVCSNTGLCACFAGTYYLYYNGSYYTTGDLAVCSATAEFRLMCFGGLFRMDVYCNGALWGANTPASSSCGPPFSATFSVAPGGGSLGCCGGEALALTLSPP